MKRKRREKCPECKSTNLSYDDNLGELICNNCGLVIKDKDLYTGKYGGNE